MIYFNKEKYNWYSPVTASLPVVLFFFLANLFLVAAPLVPPAAGNSVYADLPYYLHVVCGFGLIALGGVWWLVWAKILPRVGGYRLVRREVVGGDGLTRRVFTKEKLE